jgi:hypothetical protein
MNKKLLSINTADLMLSCKFGENYAKLLLVYINDYFDYTSFNCSENGLSKKIDLTIQHNLHVLPLSIEFIKTYKGVTEVVISCLYQSFSKLTFTYKNFTDFTELIEKTLPENVELQKFYCN